VSNFIGYASSAQILDYQRWAVTNLEGYIVFCFEIQLILFKTAYAYALRDEFY
jgi:hypothetical protein